MEQITINRTPEIIAAEINSIKNQTRTMILCNSIEIGKRLAEVKSLLPHGEWGKWLETNVDYSQSTATNLMRIFEEYGSGQFTLFGDHQAKSQALANLSYTQAVALLGVPEEEREQFVKEHDVENMSTRELQKVVKERDAAKKLNEELSDKLNAAADEIEAKKKLENQLKEVMDQLKEARSSGNTKKIADLQKLLKAAQDDIQESNQKIKELSEELKEKPIDIPAVVEKIPEDVAKELIDLRKSKQSGLAAQKFTVYFGVLKNGFNDLLGALNEMKETNPEVYEKYKSAVSVMIAKMSDCL